jgi:hypothetical protein
VAEAGAAAVSFQPPLEPKLPIVFRFPSGSYFRDSTTENIPTAVHQIDGKFFDEQNQQVTVIRVEQHGLGWQFIQQLPEGHFWIDLYTRRRLHFEPPWEVERMKLTI